MMRRAVPAYVLAAAALALLAALAFAMGRFPVAPGELAALAANKLFGAGYALAPNVETVVLQVRGPRILAALLVGAALAAAGTAYQGMFRNPLVSPDILGVSAGAALGAVLGIFLSQDALTIQVGAFAGGLAAVGLVYAVGAQVRRHDPVLSLILAGIVIGTLLGACIALIKYLADPYNQLPAITYWLLGSLAAISQKDIGYSLPLVLLGLAPMLLLRWRMNLLALPDDEARALGVDTRRLRTLVVACATLMTASVVAISGIIGWVGLLIPHAARLLVGPDFGRLLPLAMLMGAGFMLAVDTLCRTLATIEVPPGVRQLGLEYDPPEVRWSVATSLVGLAGVALLACRKAGKNGTKPLGPAPKLALESVPKIPGDTRSGTAPLSEGRDADGPLHV